jgi:hypothetical protein
LIYWVTCVANYVQAPRGLTKGPVSASSDPPPVGQGQAMTKKKPLNDQGLKVDSRFAQGGKAHENSNEVYGREY